MTPAQYMSIQLEFFGYNRNQIAQVLDVKPQTVARYIGQAAKNDPILGAALSVARDFHKRTLVA